MPNTTRSLAIAVGGLVLASALAWVFSPTNNAVPTAEPVAVSVPAMSPSPAPTLPQESEPWRDTAGRWERQWQALEKKQHALAHAVTEMHQHLQHLTHLVTAARATAPAPERVLPEASAPTATRPSLEELRAQEVEIIRGLEETFVQEAAEPTWSADSQDQIAAHVAAAALPGTIVVDIECRTLSCRVEAVHDDQDAMDTFVGYSGRLMPWDSDSMTHMLSESRGQYRTVSYFKHVRE